MITDYVVPSLALNYHCKNYQIIYESVYSYLRTCMRNKYSNVSCKSEFVWNVHIQVMLKVISISVLNMHDLVERHGCERHSFINSQTDSQTFFDQMNWRFVQMLMIPNSSQNFVYWTLFSAEGKSAWHVFMVFGPFALYVIYVWYTK